jgi:hypothetical protein
MFSFLFAPIEIEMVNFSTRNNGSNAFGVPVSPVFPCNFAYVFEVISSSRKPLRRSIFSPAI